MIEKELQPIRIITILRREKKIRKLMPCYPEKPKTDSWKRPQLTVKRKIHTISRFLTRKMKQPKIQQLMSLLKTVKQLLLSLI